MANADSPLALQHVVGLQLGTPVDLSSSLPPPDLDRALCDNSVLPSLIRKRKAYWSEINSILQKWQSINDTKCPECDWFIPINMARHLRLEHTFCQCVWRCPVVSCPSWFASEFDGNDHLEETHLFSEGHGNQDRNYTTSMWSPTARTAVRELLNAYFTFPRTGDRTSFALVPRGRRRLRGIARVYHDCPSRHTPRQDHENDIPEAESLLGTLRLSLIIPTSSVVTTMADSQSPVEQMTDLLSSESDHTQLHVPISRGQCPMSPWPARICYLMLNCCRWTSSFVTVLRLCVRGRPHVERMF